MGKCSGMSPERPQWVSLKFGDTPNVWAWLNRPRTLKFWLLAAAAVLAAPFDVGAIRTTVRLWSSQPWGSQSKDYIALAASVVLSAIVAVLVWLAARAYRDDPREP